MIKHTNELGGGGGGVGGLDTLISFAQEWIFTICSLFGNTKVCCYN